MATLKRCVNGDYVDMTPEEEAAIRAEWAANDAKAALEAERIAKEKARQEALKALQEQVLSQALTDPNAPDAVKLYASLIQ